MDLLLFNPFQPSVVFHKETVIWFTLQIMFIHDEHGSRHEVSHLIHYDLIHTSKHGVIILNWNGG